ncbi:hypothetical protein [Roseobacter sp. OBYS 0001]
MVPGKLTQNAFIQNSNGSFRNADVNETHFLSLASTRSKIT